VQEQVRHFLETGARSQIFHGVSGNRQPPGLAVDVTEPGGRGHDIFQSFSHASMFGYTVRLVNIDWTINVT
jgi:hypothetical protein